MYRFLICFIVTILASVVLATPIDISSPKADVTSQIQVARTATADSDFLSLPYEPFAGHELNVSYTTDYLWLKLDLLNPTDQVLERVIYFNSPLTGLVLFLDQGHQFESGSSLPLVRRSFQQRRTAQIVKLMPHEQRSVYIQRHSHHALSSKIFIEDPQTFVKSEWVESSVFWFYLGGILCLVFYNLLLSSYRHDAGYFYYSLFALSFMLTALNLSGVLDAYLWPMSNATWANNLMSFSAAASMTGLLFVAKFLQLAKYSPGGLRLMYVVGIINCVTFTAGFFGDFAGLQVVFGNVEDLSILFELILLIACGILSLVRGQRLAIFFLLSWVFLSFGVVSWFAMMKGLLPNNFWTQQSLIFGNMMEMLLLSLGLAYKINILDQERKYAEQKAQEFDRYHQLVRVLSHDVANALTMISGHIFRLRRVLTAESDGLKPVQRIENLIENLRGVLGFVRSEEVVTSYRASARLEPVIVSEVLNELVHIFGENLETKQLTVQIKASDNLTVMADRTVLLNQILANLLSNAIKFSFPQGVVHLHAEAQGKEICILVQDFGCGMLPEYVGTVFQGGAARSSLGTMREKGSGLGSWIVTEYTKIFNGRLQVDSVHESQSPKSGTTVRLFFPSA